MNLLNETPEFYREQSASSDRSHQWQWVFAVVLFLLAALLSVLVVRVIDPPAGGPALHPRYAVSSVGGRGGVAG